MSTLSPLAAAFVGHPGEMGSRSGIHRTVGEIDALTFVSQDPQHADDIAEGPAFSRSNVGPGLMEMKRWRLVHRRHVAGGRREDVDSPSDARKICQAPAALRRGGEMEPTRSMLRTALLDAPVKEADRVARKRMRGMHGLIEMTTTRFDDVHRLDQQTLSQSMKMGSTVQRMPEFTGQLKVSHKG